LKLSRTRQPFELASVAHIARVSEVEAQPPKKDKIFGDSHPTLSIYSNLRMLSVMGYTNDA
jgi:hypothetical protein